jgi:hypothetical protein
MAWSTHRGIWQSTYTEFLKRTSKNVWKHERKKMRKILETIETTLKGPKP